MVSIKELKENPSKALREVGDKNIDVIARYFQITPNWKDEITDKIWELVSK